MRSCVVVVVALAGCQQAEPPKPAPLPARTPGDAAAGCEQMAFAASTPVPEASGAAWLEIDGKLALVVVGDSGNDGAYAILDPDSGETGEQGKLPLGNASDDVEGLAARGDRLFGLTSAGWMREWKRQGHGFALADGPYPIGPIDAVGKRGGKAPKGVGMVCPAELGNCGRNFEGLAIAAATPTGGCAGFACSKADGRLYCLVEQNNRLVADFTRSIAVEELSDSLADCAFDDRDRLWVGDNFFGMSQVFRVDGWADPATAKVVPIERLGVGFPEVIATRGDIIYRMSDAGGSPSLMAKFRCAAIAR